jgi:hypothetical protein
VALIDVRVIVSLYLRKAYTIKLSSGAHRTGKGRSFPHMSSSSSDRKSRSAGAFGEYQIDLINHSESLLAVTPSLVHVNSRMGALLAVYGRWTGGKISIIWEAPLTATDGCGMLTQLGLASNVDRQENASQLGPMSTPGCQDFWPALHCVPATSLPC